MLKKTSGLKMRCVCVCVWVEASRGMMGSWEWVVMLSDYRLKFPMVISQRLTESMRVRESSLLLLFVSLLAFLIPVTLRFIQDTPSLGNIVLFLDKHLKVWL